MHQHRDTLWTLRKQQANKIADLYGSSGFLPEQWKIQRCATQLKFIYGFSQNNLTEITQRLVDANFCRLRHCPICQWRRSLRWQAKAFQALPRILKHHPTERWLFLTLTVKNCELTQLRTQINKMNGAFRRWTRQKNWVSIGWLKSIEVTRSSDDSAHPHIHALLLVSSSYFNGSNYLTQPMWSILWKKYLAVDYLPIVHIQAIKPELIEKAIPEIAKYACKPQDLIDETGEWLHEYTCQLHKSRGIEVGGCLKKFFKSKDINEEDDLIGSSFLNEKMLHSPITSSWCWEKSQESSAYHTEYFYNNQSISQESVIEQFVSWAGV